ncbi:MAG: dockerin type I repeat-containing protein [Clostridia bacterium]|nr:dockerin type I repeat-containing protein [Clostridia bacterium]
MKKKLASFLLTFLLLTSLLTATSAATNGEKGAPVDYGFYVGLTKVTSENASDIFGDGLFSYSPGTNTLKIRGSLTGDNNMLRLRKDGLTIYVECDATLNSGKYATVYADRDFTITGPGKLTLIGGDAAIYLSGGAVLTVYNAEIETNCSYGITGDSKGEKIIIKNSFLNVKEKDYGFSFFEEITLEGCEIVKPEGGRVYNNTTIVDKNENVANEVIIAPKFDLKVAGKQVNSYNAPDILGNGVFSYDIKNNILIVKSGFTYTSATMIDNKIKGLTVAATKNVTLNCGYAAIVTEADLSIAGLNRLTLVANSCGIYAKSGATVTIDGTDVDVSALYGITGNPSGEKLIIRNSNVHASGESGAIRDFNGGITLEGSAITSPDGAKISGGRIENKSGGVATNVTISVQNVKYGDVNSDGVVNLKDATLIRRYYVGGWGVTLDITVADVNCDGVVNLKDATLIRRYYVGGWGVVLGPQ